MIKDTRYQHQPWYIRYSRWWRYKPAYHLLAVIYTLRWLLHGAPRQEITFDDGYKWKFTFRQQLDWVYNGTAALAECKMQWYYTTEEFLKELRERKNVT